VSVRRFELFSNEAGPLSITFPPNIVVPSTMSGLGVANSIITITGTNFPLAAEPGGSAIATYVDRSETIGSSVCSVRDTSANVAFTFSSRVQLTIRAATNLVSDSNCAISVTVSRFDLSDNAVVSFIYFMPWIFDVPAAPQAIGIAESISMAFDVVIADVPAATTSGVLSFRAIDDSTRSTNLTSVGSTTCSVSRSAVAGYTRLSSWSCASYSFSSVAVNYDRSVQVRFNGTGVFTDFFHFSFLPGNPLPNLGQNFQVGENNQFVSVAGASGFPASANEVGLSLSFQLLTPVGVSGLTCPTGTFFLNSLAVPVPGRVITGTFPTTSASWDSCDARLSISRYDGRAQYAGRVGTFLVPPSITTSVAPVTPVRSAQFWRIGPINIFGTALPRSYQDPATITVIALPASCFSVINPICASPTVVQNGTLMSCQVVTSVVTSQSDLTVLDGCTISVRISKTSTIVNNDFIAVSQVVLPPVVSLNDSVFSPPVSGILYSFNVSGQYLAADADAQRSYWSFAASGPSALNCSRNAASLSCFAESRDANRKWNQCTLQLPGSLVGCSINATLTKLGNSSDSFPLGVVSSFSGSSGPVAPPRPFYLYVEGAVNPSLTILDSIAAGVRQLLSLPEQALFLNVTSNNRRAVAAIYMLNGTLSGAAGAAAFDALASTALQAQVLSSVSTSSLGVYTGVAFSFSVLPPAPVAPPTFLSAPSGNPQTAAPQVVSSPAPVSSGGSVGGGGSTASNTEGGSSLVGAIVGAIIAVAAIVAIVVVLLKFRNRIFAKKTDEDGSSYASISVGSVGNPKQSDGSGATNSGRQRSLTATTTSDNSSVAAKGSARDAYEAFEDDTLASGDELTSKLTHMLTTEFDSKWYIPFRDIKFIKLLGRGAYGQVHKARWNGVIVAVKQTLALQIDADAIAEFKREAKLLLNLQPHPSVVQVFGVSIRNGSLFLVMEYAQLGSLESLWTRPEPPKLSLGRKIRILASVARGLHHLHGAGIVHRDIAARNILIAKGWMPKITDFGMSRTLANAAEQGHTASMIGPIKSMSPESLKDRIYSSKTDIYSFGILIYEVFAEKEPFAHLDLIGAATAIREHHKTPHLPRETPEAIRELAKDCWKLQPNERPDMREVAERLAQFSEELDDDDASESEDLTETYTAGKYTDS
jgi:tRNA A-37 threonylcarbamoyl transferase component Bud32